MTDGIEKEYGILVKNEDFLLLPNITLLTLYLSMPILGSSNSAAYKDMMTKMLTNRDKIF